MRGGCKRMEFAYCDAARPSSTSSWELNKVVRFRVDRSCAMTAVEAIDIVVKTKANVAELAQTRIT